MKRAREEGKSEESIENETNSKKIQLEKPKENKSENNVNSGKIDIISALLNSNISENLDEEKKEEALFKIKNKVSNLNLLSYNKEPIDIETYSKENRLFRAIDDGNLGLVKKLLEDKYDINIQDSIYKDTPLHRAIALKNKEMVDLLLEYDPNLRIVNANGKNTLFHCIDNQPDFVDRLLKYEPTLVAVKNNYKYPIEIAISQKKIDKGLIYKLYRAGERLRANDYVTRFIKAIFIDVATENSSIDQPNIGSSSLPILNKKLEDDESRVTSDNFLLNAILGNWFEMRINIPSHLTDIKLVNFINKKDNIGMNALMWALALKNKTLIKNITAFCKSKKVYFDLLTENIIGESALSLMSNIEDSEELEESFDYLKEAYKKELVKRMSPAIYTADLQNLICHYFNL